MKESKWTLLRGWAFSRGLAFVAYLFLAMGSVVLYQQLLYGHDRGAPYGFVAIVQLLAIVSGIISVILVVSGLGSAWAVVYGITDKSAFFVKLELPALRILASVYVVHSLFAFEAGRVVTGMLELGLAALLFHEMRWLTVMRKGANGRLI